MLSSNLYNITEHNHNKFRKYNHQKFTLIKKRNHFGFNFLIRIQKASMFSEEPKTHVLKEANPYKVKQTQTTRKEK